MARIIKNAGQRLEDEFELVFYYDDNSGESTFFKCSKDGIPLLRHQQDQIRYDACLMGGWNGRRVKESVIEDRSKLVKYPAELLCDCGKRLTLSDSMNTCECEARYDLRGSRIECVST